MEKRVKGWRYTWKHRYMISLQLKPTITKALPFQWLRKHYTAIIKAVRALSIFDLKDGMSSKCITWYWLIMAINLWSLLLSAKETHKKAQEGTKTHNAATQSWYRCHAFLGWKRTSSVLGTAWLQHGFGSISFTLVGEKIRAKLVRCQLALSKQAGPARHGSARHDVGTLWSCLHCHC